MDTEAHKRNGPAVLVRIEEQHRLGIPLTRSKSRCRVSTSHQQHDDGKVRSAIPNMAVYSSLNQAVSNDGSRFTRLKM